mmetsp:Transcript_28751/g.66785  ORF Transcript_28751/g.66785 Transcript_28751/m.66785 type:complete len:918 (+) Transcript_28751:122-2875(+)
MEGKSNTDLSSFMLELRQGIAANVRGAASYQALAAKSARCTEELATAATHLRTDCADLVAQIVKLRQQLQQSGVSPAFSLQTVQEQPIDVEMSAAPDVHGQAAEEVAAVLEELARASAAVQQQAAVAIHHRRCESAAGELCQLYQHCPQKFRLQVDSDGKPDAMLASSVAVMASPVQDVDMDAPADVDIVEAMDLEEASLSLADLIFRLQDEQNEHYCLNQSLNTLDSAISGLNRILQSIAVRVWRDRRLAASTTSLQHRLETMQRLLAKYRSELPGACQDSASAVRRILAGTTALSQAIAKDMGWLQSLLGEYLQEKEVSSWLAAADNIKAGKIAQSLQLSLAEPLAEVMESPSSSRVLEAYAIEQKADHLQQELVDLCEKRVQLDFATLAAQQQLGHCRLQQADCHQKLQSEERWMQLLRWLDADAANPGAESAAAATPAAGSSELLYDKLRTVVDSDKFATLGPSAWKDALEAAAMQGASDAEACHRMVLQQMQSRKEDGSATPSSSESVLRQQVEALRASMLSTVGFHDVVMVAADVKQSESGSLSSDARLAAFKSQVGKPLSAAASAEDGSRYSGAQSVSEALVLNRTADLQGTLDRLQADICGWKWEAYTLKSLAAQWHCIHSQQRKASEGAAGRFQQDQKRYMDGLEKQRRDLQQELAKQAAEVATLASVCEQLRGDTEKKLQFCVSEEEKVASLQTRLRSLAPNERQQLKQTLTAKCEELKRTLDDRTKARNRIHAENQAVHKRLSAHQSEHLQAKEALQAKLKDKRGALQDAKRKASSQMAQQEENQAKARYLTHKKTLEENKQALARSKAQKMQSLDAERKKVANIEAQVSQKTSELEEQKQAWQKEEEQNQSIIQELETKYRSLKQSRKVLCGKLGIEVTAADAEIQAQVKKKAAESTGSVTKATA